jgi:hypothetical protein
MIGNEAMHSSQWIRDISGSLSLQALRQYIPLWSHLQVLQLQTGTADHFIWKWSPEPVVISALRTYHVFFNGQCGVLGATILRKVHVPSPPPPTISCSSGLCYLTGAGPRIAYNDTTSRTAGRVLCVQKHRRLCNTCYSIVSSAGRYGSPCFIAPACMPSPLPWRSQYQTGGSTLGGGSSKLSIEVTIP